MVWCAERTRAYQPRVRRQQAGHRVNRGDLQCLLETERREDTGRPLGHHRLPRPGRTREEDVMAARRRDFERATSELLATDVGEIAMDHLARPAVRVRRQRDRMRIVQRAHRFGQGSHRIEVEPLDDGRLAAVGRGKQQTAKLASPRGRGNRQDAPRGLDAAVE